MNSLLFNREKYLQDILHKRYRIGKHIRCVGNGFIVGDYEVIISSGFVRIGKYSSSDSYCYSYRLVNGKLKNYETGRSHLAHYLAFRKIAHMVPHIDEYSNNYLFYNYLIHKKKYMETFNFLLCIHRLHIKLPRDILLLLRDLFFFVFYYF